MLEAKRLRSFTSASKTERAALGQHSTEVYRRRSLKRTRSKSTEQIVMPLQPMQDRVLAEKHKCLPSIFCGTVRHCCTHEVRTHHGGSRKSQTAGGELNLLKTFGTAAKKLPGRNRQRGTPAAATASPHHSRGLGDVWDFIGNIECRLRSGWMPAHKTYRSPRSRSIEPDRFVVRQSELANMAVFGLHGEHDGARVFDDELQVGMVDPAFGIRLWLTPRDKRRACAQRSVPEWKQLIRWES
ncbi:hypothetical protein ABIG06_001695 [Bradyrhizobium sp. USDA 326]